MTTGVLATPPILQFFNNAGQPAANGSVLFQVGGVNAAVYQDSGLTTPLPNPVPLNSRGEISTAAGASAQCFLTPNMVYTATLFDSSGNQLWSATYVNGVQLTSVTIPITQSATNQQFANGGAVIDRLNDRVFVGAATVNDGNYPNTVKDWLSAFQTSQAGGPPNGTLTGVQMAVLGNQLVPGLGAFLAGAETINCTAAQNIIISTSSFSVNNSASQYTSAWTYYGEAHRMNSTVNTSIGFEIDVVERGSPQQYQPYATGATGTIGIISAAGAGLSSTGQNIATAAIVVGANPMAFDKGLVFASGAIQGTNGVTGTGYAIALAKGHLISWWATGGVQCGTIGSTGVTNANSVGINLAESAIQFYAQNGLLHSQFLGVNSAVNYLNFYHSVTTAPVVIQAAGSDTNIDLELQPQGGSGNIRFGTYTSGTFSQTGYVTIKDQAGNLRRLMVG